MREWDMVRMCWARLPRKLVDVGADADVGLAIVRSVGKVKRKRVRRGSMYG
jgi:hypothetical protein